MLRYYDETGLLKPACIDRYTGYRFYSVDQISMINRITFLRDAGFGVSEIMIIISNWEKDYIVEQLRNKQIEIETTINLEQDKINKIQFAIEKMDFDEKEPNLNFSLKQIPRYKILSLRKIIPNYFAEGKLWEALTCFIKENKVKVTNELDFAMYYDQEYKECDVDVEVCTTVENISENADSFTYRHSDEVQIMACTMVYGAYENIAGVYLAFAEWLSNHSLYSMTNEPTRQICHKGPWNEDNKENYLTEIQIAINKK